MKKIFLGVMLLVMTTALFAKTVTSMAEQDSKIDIASIKESYLLGKNQEKDIEVRAVVSYLGQSTDFSPKYRVFLTFFDGGEMNNVRTAFELGKFINVTATRRVKAGIYEIDGLIFNDGMPEYVIMRIDTIKVFSDSRALVLEDFEDVYFKSSISTRLIEQN